MYVQGDVPVVSGNGGNGNGSFFGNEGLWAVIILAIIFGWGRNGFGNNGGGVGVDLNGIATRSDLCSEFNFNNLESSVRSLQSGLCDGFYAVNTSLLNGFGGVNTNIMQNGYETRSAINDLGYRLQDCCCKLSNEIGTGFANTNYNLAQSTNAIIQSNASGIQRIIDYLCNEKISGLQAENALLTSQLSQNAQTKAIVDAINPPARPSFIVPNPYTGTYGYAPYSGYGCGCSCGTSIQ